MNRKQRRAQQKIDRRANPAPQPHQAPPIRARSIDRLAALLPDVIRCHETGRLAEAVVLYEQILVLRPGHPEIYCNLGAALAGLGRFVEAEAAYRRAIALKPDYGDAYNNLGNLLCELGELEDAENALRLAVNLKPDCPECHSNLGTTLKARGWPREAEAAYRQAITLNPDLADAHNNLGDLLRELGKLGDAEQSLRRAIALRPNFAEAHSNLGNALKQLGRLDEAEAAYRSAIALKPNLAQAYSNLGNVLADLGRLADAEAALRHAIALRPQLAEAFSNLGNVLKEQGRSCEAEAACRQAILLKPDHAQAHSNLGNALREQERLGEAEAAYRRAIALKPDFADAHNNLGVALKEIGRLSEARQAAERSIQLAPRNPRHYLNLSDLGPFAIQHIPAMEALAQDVTSLPINRQIELHFALAKSYEDIRRYDDAFSQLALGNALKRTQIDYDEAKTLAAFDSIQAMFGPEFLRTRGNAGGDSTVPVFIVGMPRSGTTLVEQILASHPRVHAGGELQALGSALSGLGPQASVTSFPEVMLSVSGEDLERFKTRYLSALARGANPPSHVTDKMPSNFFFLGLIDMAFPNARIIHAIRDPMDTCVSCFSKLFVAGQYHTYDLAELGRYYRRYQTLMAHWHRVLPPGRILDVHYERVVADLEGEARRIVAHCGLPWDARCLAFYETDRAVRTASATQVRQPLYRGAVGRWRAYETHLKPLLSALEASPEPSG
jgi:Flp pilus assembly protein TadD